MTDFSKIGLKKNIIEVLHKEGFEKPNEVQQKILPLELKGKNVVFTSMTGSGKTMTYLLGYLGKLNKKQNLQMVVIVPTRELCIQVAKEMKRVCEPLGIKIGMLYGGRDISGDKRTTRGRNQIIVGTPGRFIQHVNEKNIKVGEVKYLVFDESDQMFDNGFYDECSYLTTRVSRDSQIILCSATITNKVKEFIDREIFDYELVQIGTLIPEKIVQEKLFCKILEKNDVLINFLKSKKFNRALIFCNTKKKSQGIADFLVYNNIRAKSMNADLEQRERQNRLNLFKERKIKILVTTDISARGLHIPDVDLIINYDVPTREEFYIHRIGRTGRNNIEGYSLSLVCPEDEERMKNIEFLYGINAKDVTKDITSDLVPSRQS